MKSSTLPQALLLVPTVALALALVVQSAGLRAQSLSSAEQAKVKKMIEQLDLKLNGGTEKNNGRALSICQAALKSPKATYEFFMNATKEYDFEDAGKRESDWREWRTRNEDRLKSKEHVAALQYQLRFLVLTLQIATAENQGDAVKEALPELMSYYDGLAKNFEKLEDHFRVLHRPVLDSIFAKHLKLNVTVAVNDGWLPSPLPLSSAYDQIILPSYRRAKDHAMIQSAWDKRIIQESQTLAAEEMRQEAGPPGPGAGPGPGPGRGIDRRRIRDPREREREERREESRLQKVSEEDFTRVRLPELRWGKARDGLLFGPSRAAGFAALGEVLQDNLAHQQAMIWLDELKTLANSSWKAETYYQDKAE